jgi:hypothetical protein
MSSNNRRPLDDDVRAEWERPVLRRLVTQYAEASGIFQSEGQPPGGGQNCIVSSNAKSCKGFVPPG